MNDYVSLSQTTYARNLRRDQSMRDIDYDVHGIVFEAQPDFERLKTPTQIAIGILAAWFFATVVWHLFR